MNGSPPALEVLLPAARRGEHVPPDPAEAHLCELYRPPEMGRAWLRANMVSTLDGAGTGPDERSGSINSPADLRVFTTLRALADVVLIGAGTVRAEGYRAPRIADRFLPGRRDRGQPGDPPLAIVTRSGEVPLAVLAGDPSPFVFTVASDPNLRRLREHLPAGRLHVHDAVVDLARVLATLAAQGLPNVLTEGGPHLLGSLIAAGVLDELCLTWSPLMVGGPAPRILDGITWLAPPRHADAAHLLHADGVLLGRWLLRSPKDEPH